MLNVSDFPRPPVIERWEGDTITLYVNDVLFAAPSDVWVYKETDHPPNFYFPREQVVEVCREKLSASDQTTICEYKGVAEYVDLSVPPDTDDGTGYVLQNVGWFYQSPAEGFEEIKGYVSFYPNRGITCFVGDEQVTGESTTFYGGWIWSEVMHGKVEDENEQTLINDIMDFIQKRDTKQEYGFFVGAYELAKFETVENIEETLGFGALGGFRDTDKTMMVEALLLTVAQLAQDYGVRINIDKSFDVQMLDLNSFLASALEGKIKL